ncbi:MAG: SDR family NAD(P)-dependent oxidoreductase [Deltaproteobacteria bacterium]|nr:SDR family NAD(P)-dependent oxidoreductase [Deltaproteobacteria bacterium]
MNYLITGGCGFLGSNIAARLMKQKEKVVVFDNLYREGAEKNLEWLRQQGSFTFVHGDVRNRNDVERIIREKRPDVMYHLAGQVAMTTSIANPQMDFEINALGSFHVLDSVRRYSPESIVVYSSTNKVYGDLEWAKYEETETRYLVPDFPRGFPETVNLEFHSPYGASKGAADQYMLDFHRIYGIKTVVFRHSSMYGGRQYVTYDQGWIGWFCQQAIFQKDGLLKEPFTISGNGKQVRDLLYADDTVDLYLAVVDHIDKTRGQAFNIGGGMQNSLSLLELFALLEGELQCRLDFRQLPPRESDQKIFVADIAKIRALTEWEPKVDKLAGIRKMLEWTRSRV